MSSTAPVTEDPNARSNVTPLARSGDAPRCDNEKARKHAAIDDAADVEDGEKSAESESCVERAREGAVRHRRRMAVGLAILAAAGLVTLIALAPWTAGNRRLSDRMIAELGQVSERIDALEASSREAAAARADLAAGADAVARALRGLTADLATLEARLDAAETRDADAVDAITAFRQKLSDTQASLGLFGARLEKLSVPRPAPRAPVVTLSSSGPAPGGRTAASRSLPFTPAAIDLWAGAPQLAIRDKEGLTNLAIGEAHQGWTFVSADRDAGAVIFQSSDGVSRRYVLGQGFAPLRRAHPAAATLTVSATPADARVRIMNIKPVYAPQMPLAPGLYDIEVTAPGYKPHRQWIRIGDGAHDYKVTLEKSPERPS